MVFKSLQIYNSIIKFDELKSPDEEWEILESIDEGNFKIF